MKDSARIQYMKYNTGFNFEFENSLYMNREDE